MNDFALDLALNTSGLTVLCIVVFVLGFVVAILVRKKSRLSMSRSIYFAANATLYAAVSAIALMWGFLFDAIEANVVWVLMLAVLTLLFAVAFANGAFSHARSVSAYGDGSKAIWGVIPIANLVLLFKRGLGSRGKMSWTSVLTSIISLLAGTTMLAFSFGLDQLSKIQMNGLMSDAQNRPIVQSALLRSALRTRGLESTLQSMLADVKLGPIDSITTLTGVEVSGQALRYSYTLTEDVRELPPALSDNIVNKTCQLEPLFIMLSAGAVIEYAYTGPNGNTLTIVKVTKDLCPA